MCVLLMYLNIFHVRDVCIRVVHLNLELHCGTRDDIGIYADFLDGYTLVESITIAHVGGTDI